MPKVAARPLTAAVTAGRNAGLVRIVMGWMITAGEALLIRIITVGRAQVRFSCFMQARFAAALPRSSKSAGTEMKACVWSARARAHRLFVRRRIENLERRAGSLCQCAVPQELPCR